MALPIEIKNRAGEKRSEAVRLHEAAKQWVEDYLQEGADRVKIIEQYYYGKVGREIAEDNKGDLHLVEVTWFEKGNEKSSLGLLAKNLETDKALLILEGGSEISVLFNQFRKKIIYKMPMIEGDSETVVDTQVINLWLDETDNNELLGFTKYRGLIEVMEGDNDGESRGVRMWNLSQGLQMKGKLEELLNTDNVIRNGKIHGLNEAKDAVNCFNNDQGIKVLDMAEYVLGLE